MARWFRSYADKHRNPKIARLSDSDFRLWDQMLCIASENDGHIPPAEDLKHLLNRRLDHLSCALKRLIDGRLIEPLDDGYTPRNWNEKQYKSDTSTPRVKKHRARRNVARNVSETPPDTETDTEVPLDKESNGAKPVDPDAVFWANAKAFIAPECRGDPGKVVGAWCRDHGKEATAQAITRAQLERPVQRIPFVAGCLKQSSNRGGLIDPC